MLTESQQQLEAQQLLYAREIGIPVSSKRILSKLTIQDKEELMEEIEQTEKAQAEQQQQMAQLQMQQMQVDNQTKISYAKSQDGLANERNAKIQLDKALNAERLARAQEEKTQGTMNLLKAAKELEGIDINNLLQTVQILSQIQQLTQSPQQAEAEQAQETTASSSV